MRFASSITASADPASAVEQLLSDVRTGLSDERADLAFLFVTPHFEEDVDAVVARVGEGLEGAPLIGCAAEGTIGADREIERRPSMSLLAARLPGVSCRLFTMTQDQLQSATGPASWESLVGVAHESRPVFFALGDPFSLDIQRFVGGVNTAFSGAPLFGGNASAAEAPGQNRLIVRDRVLDAGLVGVALTGNLRVRGVVSQGCTPIGQPFVITKSSDNIIRELGGKPPLARLQSVYTSLSPREEKLAGQALLIGSAINEYKDSFTRGDFLIHNIMGADRSNGAIAIAAPARVGTTVQFHIRDARCADQDLRHLLAPYAHAPGREPAAGALMFGCNGRGTRMWPESGHDIHVLHEIVGDVPTGGCFCAGEFGPIGGTNFIHAFTAGIALFYARADD